MKTKLEKCKGIKAMLLAVVMLFGFSVESWGWYESVVINNIWYRINFYSGLTPKRVEVWGFLLDENTTAPSSIEIQDYVTYHGEKYPVDFVNGEAFANETSLKYVTLPSTMKYIGERAFAGCTNLISIYGLNNVTRILDSAFEGCSKMENVYNMNSVIEIHNRAFEGCTSLSSITFPSSLSLIGSYAFANSGLWTVDVDGTWKSSILGEGIFKNCKFASLPTAVTYYGKRMFEGCPLSGTISIPSSIKEIPEACFKGCQISTVSLHNTATIADSAFWDCPIKTLVLPSSVKSIDAKAFNKVQTLNINSPTIAGKNDLIHSVFFDSPISKINFSDDCTYIGESFAVGKTTLTSVTLPKDGVIIGSTAFRRCPITGSLTLNNAVIREDAFAYTKISNITLTGTKTKVEENAFANTTLETFKITANGSAEYSIADNAFTGTTVSNVNIDGVMFNSNTFANCNLNEVSLDNTIVPEQAFLGNRTLKRVTLGANCLKINANAFSCCPNLQYAIFSNNRKGNTQIFSEAFANCNSLNDVTLNGSFTLKDYVFKGCLDGVDLTINDMSTFSENSLAGRKWRIITVNNETPTGDCLKNIEVSTISFPNATTLGENAILENSTVKTLNAPKLQSISHKAVGYAKNLTTVGTIKNGYLSSSGSLDFGCVYSADRKTLLYICPGRSETILDSTVEKIDLQGTHYAAPGDSQERGIHVMDATYITDHNVTPINNNNARACAKFIRVADGCRKYFSAFEKLAYKSVIVEPNNNGGGVKGDVNGDGKVTAADVQNLYEMLNE